MVTARRASDNVAFCTHREEVVSDDDEELLLLVALPDSMVRVSSGVARDLKFPSRSSHITTE